MQRVRILLADDHMYTVRQIRKATYRTVQFHKSGMIEELRIATDSELMRYAMNHGLIQAAQIRPSAKA